MALSPDCRLVRLRLVQDLKLGYDVDADTEIVVEQPGRDRRD